jgi:hypothetical protein
MLYPDVYHNYKEALPHLAMLTFDMGMSPDAIKQSFDEGLYIKFNPKMNFYAWHEYTCAKCPLRTTCEMVDDPYNKDGDCIVK